MNISSINSIDGQVIKSKSDENKGKKPNLKIKHYIGRRRRVVMFDLTKNKVNAYEKALLPKHKFFYQEEDIVHNRLKYRSKKTREHLNEIEKCSKSIIQKKGNQQNIIFKFL